MRMLRPDTYAMTGLLALITTLGPLSVDMYLPSLPDIGRALNAGNPEVQLTISVYLVGFAIAQIFYGPLADRYGRRPVLQVSIALFMLASLGCAFAPSIEVLIAARFVQSIGGAGASVIARAVVRDLYAGARAGRELSLMGAAMSLAPIIGPMIGGALQATFGWQSTFLLMAFAGLTVICIIWQLLPETLPQRREEPISLGSIFRGYGGLLADPPYMAYLGIIAFTYAGLFAWISGASFVLRDIYGMDPLSFGVGFGVSAGGYLIGTLLATRIVMRRGLGQTIGIGAAMQALAGLVMLLGLALGWSAWPAILLPVAVYVAGLGCAGPQSMAGALTPYPTQAGTASSLFGFIRQTWSAIVGAGVGFALGATAWPMALAITAMGGMTLLIWAVTREARAQPESIAAV